MSDTIAKYLNQLRGKLKGCDSATVQDALSDTEIHLNSGPETA